MDIRKLSPLQILIAKNVTYNFTMKKSRLAVSAIFQYKEKIYYIKRQNHLRSFPGYTSFPGGKIDKEDVPEKLIVLNGDILTNIYLNKMLEFHHNQENMITIAGKKHFINNPYGTLTCVENQLVGFVEKPVYESIINTGIYCINKDVLSFINGKENYDMPSLIEKTQQTKNLVGVYTDDFSWLDIGAEDSFREAPDFAKKILFDISNDL